MQFEVKLDSEAIEKQVTEAIITSAFGKRLTEAIDGAITRLGSSYSYSNELSKWVENEMRRLVVQTIEDNYKAQIEASLREKLTPELLKEACQKVIQEGIKRVGLVKDY